MGHTAKRVVKDVALAQETKDMCVQWVIDRTSCTRGEAGEALRKFKWNLGEAVREVKALQSAREGDWCDVIV